MNFLEGHGPHLTIGRWRLSTEPASRKPLTELAGRKAGWKATGRLTGFQSLHRFLKNHSGIAQACGLPPGRFPTDRTFSRRFQKLDGILMQATAQLLHRVASRKVLRWALTVIDGTALVAKGRPGLGQLSDRGGLQWPGALPPPGLEVAGGLNRLW